ncbi:hypothetical protein CLU79DRAFT_447700 [Phycomyces nitens]|nr:hypothetical protein CLU79DRAFT_447700 [Phycomyces nitens]
MSELPFEVLSVISKHVTKKTASECSIVCKAWTNAFQERLWDTISITTADDFLVFYSKSDSLQNCCPYVREVYISNQVDVSAAQVSILQTHFQNLRRLQMRSLWLDLSIFGAKTNWSVWKSLQDIDIIMPNVQSDSERHNIFQILSQLPRLKALAFSRIFNERTVRTWNDLDNIHSYFPNLEYLRTDINFGPIHKRELHNIRDVVPARSIKQMSINIPYTKPHWLFYFACKYPSLKEIKWSEDGNENPEEMWRDSLNMFATLQSPFSHLNTVELHGIVKRDVPIDTKFWKVMKDFKVPIKCLLNDVTLDYYRSPKSDNSFAETLKACSSTVKTLTYKIEEKEKSLSGVYVVFEPCPRLVSLNLDMHTKHVALDTLLDHCPVLRILMLKCAFIYRFDNTEVSESAAEKPHGLRSITLLRAKTNPSLYKYISYRCKNLNKMRLDFLTISGPLSYLTNDLRIEMPYTSFSILHVANVRFWAPKTDSFTLGLKSKNNYLSNLIIDQENQPQEHKGSLVSPGIADDEDPLRLQLHLNLDIKHTEPSFFDKIRSVGSTSSILNTSNSNNHSGPIVSSWAASKCITYRTSKESMENKGIEEHVLLRCKSVDSYRIMGTNGSIWYAR